MEKIQLASKILLSLALIYFSTAIIMFVVETGRTRQAIPEILNDINRIKVDANIPKILDQLSEITQEVASVREQIPAVLERVDQINRQIPDILSEVAKTRKAIPPILEEVAAVRQQLPESLNKAEKIVKDAKEISIKSKVGGVARDVVTTPFKLIQKGVEQTIDKEAPKEVPK